MWTVNCPKPEDTHAFGRALGEIVEGPVVLALVGELGAGKTCLAQGIGVGLGVAEPVVSPTFILIAEYQGRLPLLHADAYRLEEWELASVGLEEALEEWQGVALVEWADRFPEVLPGDHLWVELTDHVVEIRANGQRHEQVLQQWKESWGYGR